MPVRVLVSEGSRRWAHELDDRILRWIDRHAPDMAVPASEVGEVRYISAERLASIVARPGIGRDDIVGLKAEALAVHADITAHLNRLKARSPNGRIDVRDFGDLTRQIKSIGVKVDILNSELGRRRVQLAAQRKPLPYYFIEEARRILDPDSFEAVWSAAQDAQRLDDDK